AAAERPVQQERDDQSQYQADQHHRRGEHDRRDDRVARGDVGEHPPVVVEPGEPDLVRVVGVPVHERDDQRAEERQLRHDDQEDQRGQQRGAARPVARPAQRGVLPQPGPRLRGRLWFERCTHDSPSARERYRSATSSASSWPRSKASCTVTSPAIAELTSCDTWVPRSGNSGIPTNWIPSAGRGCTPGLRGSAVSMARFVCSANAPASARYCGFSYVDARLPAGTFDQPICSPTSCSYSLLDAHETNCHAASFFSLASWIPQDHAYSHPELGVFTTGAGA